MAEADSADRLPLYAGLTVAVGAVGIAGAYFLPGAAESRLSAFVGVGAAVFSGAIALTLKRWALAHSLKRALAMLGVVFLVRLVLVAAGLLYVVARSLGTVAFTLGFFGVYFALQWVEISYVLSESKRRGPGGA